MMTNPQAEQIANFINSKPKTVFYNAKVCHKISLGEQGFYVEAENIASEITSFESYSECATDWDLAPLSAH